MKGPLLYFLTGYFLKIQEVVVKLILWAIKAVIVLDLPLEPRAVSHNESHLQNRLCATTISTECIFD